MSDNSFDAGEIQALVFDVFGTVVDWRTSIIREGQMLSAATGLQVDWPAFADAWRAGYAAGDGPHPRRPARPGPTSTRCTGRSSTNCCRASACRR